MWPISKISVSAMKCHILGGRESQFYNISHSHGRDGRQAPHNVERFSIAVSSRFFMKEC